MCARACYYLQVCAGAPVPDLSTLSFPPFPPGSPHHLKRQDSRHHFITGLVTELMLMLRTLVVADPPSRSQFMMKHLFSSVEYSLEDLLSAANGK